jgi:hypothetical protein
VAAAASVPGSERQQAAEMTRRRIHMRGKSDTRPRAGQALKVWPFVAMSPPR